MRKRGRGEAASEPAARRTASTLGKTGEVEGGGGCVSFAGITWAENRQMFGVMERPGGVRGHCDQASHTR